MRRGPLRQGDKLIAPGRQLRRIDGRAERAGDLDREVSNKIRPYG